ncbi:hypothetical protein FBY58_0487 [Zymomonas mobilis]|uniref:Ancillary SecYEG translocon subunit/Cell division coordinator CpoB TPR domain-containing protein n=1 Tax=Zymomonas mobilis TaxID=542 RepID=A0A542W024_ZYMMB|nr:hypothetical protein FBY58_0487 [Zymomonas mobilis]
MADLPHNSNDNQNTLQTASETSDQTKEPFCATHRRCITASIIAILLLVGIGGIGCWLYHRHKQEAINSRGDALAAAIAPVIQGGQVKDVATLDKLIASGDPVYANLGRFLKAGVFADKGDVKSATALYQTVLNDPAAGDILHAVATLHLSAIEMDTVPPENVIKRLQPLVAPGSRWLGSAGEMQAAAYLKENKPEQAVKIYQRIASDTSVPEDIRERAKSLANSYADILGNDKEKPGNPVATTPASDKK